MHNFTFVNFSHFWFAIKFLINSKALFLDNSSGAATVTSPVSLTSTFAPDVSTISLIVAPPLLSLLQYLFYQL